MVSIINNTVLIIIVAVFCFLMKIVDDIVRKRHTSCIPKYNNIAYAIVQASLYITCCNVLSVFMLIGNHTITENILSILKYGLVTMGLLIFSLFINDKFILWEVDNKKAVNDGNIGVAICEAFMIFASGLILKSSFVGEGMILAGVAFFLLGQAIFVLISFFLHAYAKDAEMGEMDSAIILGAKYIALSFIISKAVSGDFIGWVSGFKAFLQTFFIGGALLYIFYVIAGKIFGFKKEEFTKGSNIGKAIIFGTIEISYAYILALLI